MPHKNTWHGFGSIFRFGANIVTIYNMLLYPNFGILKI